MQWNSHVSGTKAVDDHQWGIYIRLSIPTELLLTIVAAIITKKYLCTRRKVLQISKVSLNDPKNGKLENLATVRYQADENIYIENNLYNMHSDTVAC